MAAASGYDTSSSSELEDALSHGLAGGLVSGLSAAAAAAAAVEKKASHDSESASGSQDSPRSSSPDQETPGPVSVVARAYQLEMLEESLKQNVIVAMDTGSGKTQVAVLRIQKELEQSEKIVWFLAPTVSLALQQFDVIRAQIPGVQSRFICGDDDVNAWSTKPGVWDAVLLNTRIVVSTYRILFDAVSHALVRLSSVGLLVVDEAHNCVKMNSIARLMKEHYTPRKARGLPVPQVLGLTASPVMRSRAKDLEVLEQTLNSVCKTPSKHRNELIAHVNRPEMQIVAYGDLAGAEDPVRPTSSMSSLERVFRDLDLTRDPYILHLKARNTLQSREKLRKAYMTQKTYCRNQMKAFCNRAKLMCENIGPWAADFYIHRVISTFLGDANMPQESSNDLMDQERRYLAEAFLKVDARSPPDVPTALSPKAQALVDLLGSHPGDDTVGIVFATERATVAVLSHILSVHPRTRHRYRVGAVVGTSKVPGRRTDFLDLSRKEYIKSLDDFRSGRKNLLVATSVLEEGIDVPACNLVVCFDKPSNLKSFIQRRGRARMSASKLCILVEDPSDGSAREWQSLERIMKEKYEDEARENERLREIERGDDAATGDYPVLRDEETGAQLTIHDAKQHLEHFCATLSTRKFVDWSPFYVIHDLEGNPVDRHVLALRKATVHLPVSLAPELRRFESLYAWQSEANACKDAAFQAYAKLYEVGLVGRHLLPIRETDLVKEVEPREGVATVREQFNPWPLVAQAWRDRVPTWRRRLTISSREDGPVRAGLELVLPVEVPYMEEFDLYWDHESSWVVSMERDTRACNSADADDGEASHTPALLAMAFGHRWQVAEKQYPIRFVCLDQDIRLEDMGADEISTELMGALSSTRLIRDVSDKQHPYFYVDWLPGKPPADMVGKLYNGFDETPEQDPHVVVKRWPRKVGFFRRPQPNTAPMASSKPYPRVLPASFLRVDRVPAVYAHVGMLIPAITHALEGHLVARDLLENRLEKAGITDLSLVVTAISARAASGPTDYERFEFLGDAILKLCTTVNCSAKYLKFPEGYLSPLKDKIVANARLSRAAVEFGLDRYIIHKALAQHKWRPTYVEDLLEKPPPTTGTRVLSTKTLADVVEALIGASYVSGGMPKALACMSLFLPEVEWQSIEHGREVLYGEAPDDEALPPTMRLLEPLVGYTFTKKALLVEAMTHPSCNGPGVRASLDRLEFLGDAILDYIVVKTLFDVADPAPLDNVTLHLLRTALVNADILGFLVMEWSIQQERIDVVSEPSRNNNNSSSSSTSSNISSDNDDEGYSSSSSPFSNNSSNSSNSNNNSKDRIHLVPAQTTFPLWSFMRHASPDMGLIQRATAQRHAAMRAGIGEALGSGDAYPWAALTRLQPQKFYSDVLESLLGAVWVDSGSLAACEAVLERVGLLRLARRLVRDRVRLMHPKEELGMVAAGETVEYVVTAATTTASHDHHHHRHHNPEVVFEGEVDGDGILGGDGGGGSGGGSPAEEQFVCRVLVGGECVAEVGGALSREEARTRAAEVACRVLRERKGKKGGEGEGEREEKGEKGVGDSE